MINVFRNLDWSYLTNILLSVLPALICITLHELSHGLAALAMGDTTAKDAGRLTLNPLKSMDITGLLMLVVFHFGWAKPVPVNPRRAKNPRLFMALTALAGPLSNILISCVFLFLYGLFYRPLYNTAVGGWLLSMIGLTAYISIGYAVFNIIPIPPLDGSKVLFALLPERAYMKLMRYERYGMIALVLLSVSGLLGAPLSEAMSAVYDFLWPIAQFSSTLF